MSGKGSLHKKDYAMIAGGLGLAAAAPWALPELAAAGGAGAAGIGAALTPAEVAASSAAAASVGEGVGGLGGYLAGVAPAADASLYGGELASVGASGGGLLGGASPQAISTLPGDMGGSVFAGNGNGLLGNGLKGNVDKAMKGMNMVNMGVMAGQMFQPSPATAPAPMMQPPQAAPVQSNAQILGQSKPQAGGMTKEELLKLLLSGRMA